MTQGPFLPEQPHATEQNCALCGLPVGRSRNRLEIHGEVHPFCCPGCKAVYQILINTPGLTSEGFRQAPAYRTAVAAGLIPDPTLASPLTVEVRAEPETGAELIIEIQGMWCSACSWLIENVLAKLAGVQSTRVHFLTDMAHVRYVPHRVRPEQILDTISKMGYGARPSEQDPVEHGTEARLFARLAITGILSLNVMMISWALYFGFFQDLGNDGVRLLTYTLWLLATPAVLYGGYPIYGKALLGLRHGAMSMETIITAGCFSAYGYSTVQMLRGDLHVYFDTATMLVTLVLFGKHLESRARERITGGIKALYRLGAGKARLERDGREHWVKVDQVEAGHECNVMEGERIPVDGVIVSGNASVDEASLTGEATPKAKGVGDGVLAGSDLVSGSLRIRATRPGSSTALQHMIQVMMEALARKDTAELLADRVTRWLTPCVLTLALATGAWLWMAGSPLEVAVLRALTVLLITCPCALGIAVPLAKVAAVWAARSLGAVIRNPSAIEKLSRTDIFLLDKTGTVTEGRFRLRGTLAIGLGPEEALELLGGIEAHSSHVLAREVLSQCDEAGLQLKPASDISSVPGMGLSGHIEGVPLLAGNVRWMEAHGIPIPDTIQSALESAARTGLTPVLLARDGSVCALFSFGDSIRSDAPLLLNSLRSRKIKAHLVSGDSFSATERVASHLDIETWTAQALPAEKVAHLEHYQARGHTVAMVGDGINDGAALAQADVGIAFGTAADLIEGAADISILSGRLESVPGILDLSRRSTRIIKQNLFAAFFYNALAIPLAMAGWLNPLIAVLAMVASSLTVIANTLRINANEREDSRGSQHAEPVTGGVD